MDMMHRSILVHQYRIFRFCKGILKGHYAAERGDGHSNLAIGAGSFLTAISMMRSFSEEPDI